MTTDIIQDTGTEAAIVQLLDDIYDSLDSYAPNMMSLMTGESGVALFRYHYLKFKGRIDKDVQFAESLQQMAETSIGFEYPTFANGKPGVNWFFAYLGNSGVLDDEDVATLTDDKHILSQKAIEHLHNDNCDFLHGAVGIAYYLLYDKQQTGIAFYETIFNLLDSLRLKCDDPTVVPNLDMKTGKLIPDEVNMGLAHGIPSIIKFCIQCYKQKVCPKQARKLAYDLINFMINHTNSDISKGFFPAYASLKEQEDRPSRLAWCYGDLGAAFILYQAGIVFKDDNTRDFALTILLHSTKNRTPEDTRVTDAFFCHGSSGIAYIYNKMWHYTHNPIFKETRDHWIRMTLDLRVHKDGVAGYKHYDTIANKWDNQYGMLEGVSGIGLALLSCITNDFSWDYCLMLND
jgi:lantibiotic modifying enzyme